MIATELPKTLQGFFDNAWQHAVVEKNPPCKTVMRCLYRHKDNACLIGASIPEKLYRADMEDTYTWDLLSSLGIHCGDIDALERLQETHDGFNKIIDGDYSSYIELALRRYAAARSLNIPASH